MTGLPRPGSARGRLGYVGRPDVEREAVLAVGLGRFGIRRARDARHGSRLRRDRPESGHGLADLAPRLGCLWRSPAQLALGCSRRIWDAGERPQIAAPHHPLDPPLGDGHDSLHRGHPMDGEVQGSIESRGTPDAAQSSDCNPTETPRCLRRQPPTRYAFACVCGGLRNADCPQHRPRRRGRPPSPDWSAHGFRLLPAGAWATLVPPRPPFRVRHRTSRRSTRRGSQVAQIEATLTKEEQQTSDPRRQVRHRCRGSPERGRGALRRRRQPQPAPVRPWRRRQALVATDAVAAYVYGTPETGFASYFSQSANLNQARNQYTNQIVGDLTKDETALNRSESRLQSELAQQQAAAAQAQSEAAQAKSLALANEQEATATKATLSQVQGQLAQEVAQAAIEEAQQEAAAGRPSPPARSSNRRRRLRLQAAAAVAGAVGQVVEQGRGNRCGQSGLRLDHPGPGQRQFASGGAPPRGGTGCRVPAGGALRLRRRAAGCRFRLLGPRAMGLGPGRCVHSPHHRDAVAGPRTRLT